MESSRPFDARLDAYLSILLSLGVNLQADQTLVITIGSSAPIEEAAPIVRRVARQAYDMGARHVYVNWDDAEFARTSMAMTPEQALAEIPTWRFQWLEELAGQGAAFLNLAAPDPDLYRGINPLRVATVSRASARASEGLSASAMSLRHAWCIGSFATTAWARLLYPEKSAPEALAALWDYIFTATRVNQPDPIEAWRMHLAGLNDRVRLLDSARFQALRYRAPGTDLRLELPARQHWNGGGGAVSARGVPFVPNLPTEEVFCLPVRTGVDGVVAGTMPLVHNGALIDGIRLRFEAGRIVEFDASVGRDALETLIETDEGSHYLGEAALVPAGSPTNIGTPVFNTLFDENASCHLAIGRSYPICLEGGASMSAEELRANGANSSLVHVDFMIGSEALDIDGETATGELVPVFRSGAWAL